MNNFIYEDGKIYLKNENNEVIAQINYEILENNVYNITHTFVDESLRGQKIASKLVEEVLKITKEKNGKLIASCSYAASWIEKNKDRI